MNKKGTIKKTASKKCRQIIDTARNLFWFHGLRRVSVEEICQTAGVSKMTFYKYFKNKIDLILFILNEMFREGVTRYKGIMAQNVPFAEKAKEVIRMKLEGTKDFSQEMLKDLMQGNIPEVAELMQSMKEKNYKLILDDMFEAQKKGEIRRDINLQFIPYFLNKMADMAGDEQMISMYESPQSLTAELINFFFYGILTEKGEDK
ncbi:MAG: TetR/AcrR family transcriptional regulator [Candidatus Aminicenantes bacterium]|nr:TetR/AcrR family transcriptional regulator [Candidatus Aminicenantes bacterium]